MRTALESISEWWGWGSDSPRPQSGPLNPKKQWHVPATQSPFPKQLLGQSSIESAREQSRDFWVMWLEKIIYFPATHFFRLIISFLLMTVMSTCSIRLNVYVSLLATHLSGTYVSHKWSDSRQAQPSCDYLCLYPNCKSMKFSQFPNELNIKSATFATFDQLNLIHWLHIASWWGFSNKKKKLRILILLSHPSASCFCWTAWFSVCFMHLQKLRVRAFSFLVYSLKNW